MKRQWLHDIAKFAAGLAAADFILFWWLSTLDKLPNVFLGLTLSSEMLTPAMLVDFFLLIMLVHYGWNIGKIPQIKERAYLTIAGAIFTVVALGHLVRVLYSGNLSIFGYDVPVFLSWIGVAVATYLAYASFHFAGRMKR